MANMLSIEISSCARSFGQLGLGDTLGETDDFSSEGRRERRPLVILGRCTPTWIKMMKDHDVCYVCCGGNHTALLTKASSSSSSERKSSGKNILFHFRTTEDCLRSGQTETVNWVTISVILTSYRNKYKSIRR